MKSTKIQGGKKPSPNPIPPGRKPGKPVETPPDHPGTPPDQTTPPYIEDPKPSKPKKIV